MAATTKGREQEQIPEDVRKVKEKLEAETGKKYRYRAPKKDLPGVGDLLRQGHTNRTWKTTIGYPLILALMFALSLFAFHHLVLTKPTKRRGKGFAMNAKPQRRVKPVAEPAPTEPTEPEHAEL